MKTHISILLSLFVLLMASISCIKDVEKDPENEIDLNLKSQDLIKADNEFGLDIFKLIKNDNDTPTNFMISPLSISMALSMAYNGAETETKTEMEEALRIKGFSRDVLNGLYKSLIEALTTTDPKVAMEIANSIWYKNDYNIETSFLEVNKDYYNAEVTEADFLAPETIGLINQWVSDKTHTKIPEIINEISSDMVMFLINAIYFKGTWSQEFNPENTQMLSFKLDNGDFIQTEMMGRKDTLNYLSNEVFSALEIPYGNGKFNMMLMLPNYDKNVDDILDQMSPENWIEWQNSLEITENIDIRLPKFKIEYEVELNKMLKAMGMTTAFTTNADFSGINKSRDLFISYVKHKTFVEVDEKGTEAAAVTIIGFETTSIDPNKPKEVIFHCDRPFLFAITEKETSAILFMGKLGNPIAD